MTTQQSWREAFEVWARTQTNRIDALNRKGDGYAITTAQIMWLAWQAALAQQGQEVGEAVAIGTVKIERGREGAPSMKWVKLDLDLLNTLPIGTTLYTAATNQQAVELRDALKVAEAALADIGDADREPGDDIAWAERRAAVALPKVRAALLAALAGKTEVE